MNLYCDIMSFHKSEAARDGMQLHGRMVASPPILCNQFGYSYRYTLASASAGTHQLRLQPIHEGMHIKVSLHVSVCL